MEFLKWLFTAEKFSIKLIPLEVIGGPPILIVVLSISFLLSICWVYRDAKKRGKSPFFTILLIAFFTWPYSFIWWLWLRPAVISNHSDNLSIHSRESVADLKEMNVDVPRYE